MQGGSEVGAAGVAAAQGAFDVGRACVVVKLGFGQGSEEGWWVVAGGEIEEGARDRRAWKADIEDEVSGAELASEQA